MSGRPIKRTLRGLAVQLSPEIYLPEGGNALYVFALPE